MFAVAVSISLNFMDGVHRQIWITINMDQPMLPTSSQILPHLPTTSRANTQLNALGGQETQRVLARVRAFHRSQLSIWAEFQRLTHNETHDNKDHDTVSLQACQRHILWKWWGGLVRVNEDVDRLIMLASLVFVHDSFWFNFASAFGPWQRGRREIVQRVLKKLPLAEVNEAGRTFPVMQCDAMRLEGRTLFPNVQFTEKIGKSWNRLWQAQREAAFREAQLMRRISRNCNPPQLIYNVKCCNALTHTQAHTQTHSHTHTKLHEPTHAHYIQNFDMLSLSAFVTNTCRTQLESPSRKQQLLCGMFFLKCITHRCPVTRTRTQPSASTPDGDQST